jgi:ribonuclease HI
MEKRMRERRVKIYFDGGCRPNPGEMAAAVVIRGVTHHFPRFGYGTNSDAEWLALLHAMRIAHSAEAGPFDLLGDSALVVNQANGAWPCRSPELLAHRRAFLELAAIRAPVRIRRIARSQNLAGIALDRLYARHS